MEIGGKSFTEFQSTYNNLSVSRQELERLSAKTASLPDPEISPMKLLKEQGLEAFKEFLDENPRIGYCLRDEHQHQTRGVLDSKVWALLAETAQKIPQFTFLEVEGGAIVDVLPRNMKIRYHDRLEQTLKKCSHTVPTILMRDIFQNGYDEYSKEFITKRLEAIASTVERAIGRTVDNKLPIVIDNFLASNDPEHTFVSEELTRLGFILRSNIAITPEIENTNIEKRAKATNGDFNSYQICSRLCGH